MRLVVGARSDIGRARDRNEDALLIQSPVFAVADGMGGHRGGDVASSLAIETLRSITPNDSRLASVVEGIREANRRILEQGLSDRAVRGMGTTLTALVEDGEKAHIAHVGDSRAYLFRGGALQQLSQDHTLVQRMVNEGKIRPEDAGSHPQRNILTRVLGVDEPLDVEQMTLDVHPGDRLLLCTDGLTGMLGPDRIRRILETQGDAQRAADVLVEEANRAGGDDNITVIVVDVVDGEPAGVSSSGSAARRAPEAAVRREPGPEPVTLVHGIDTLAPALSGEAAHVDERRSPLRRIAMWSVAIVVIAVVAGIGVKLYLDRQWYVGETDGRVAIFNGIPSSIAGHRLSRAERITDLPAASVERLRPYAGLEDGITSGIDNRSDAEALVAQMRRDLAATSGGR